MAVIEASGLMKFKDDAGNVYILYPITTADHVDGIENYVLKDELSDYLPKDGKDGKDGEDGEDGGYYTPGVTSPDQSTIRFSFTPSKEGMSSVEPVDITMPSSGGANIEDDFVLITVEDIDTICGASIQMASEVTF